MGIWAMGDGWLFMSMLLLLGDRVGWLEVARYFLFSGMRIDRTRCQMKGADGTAWYVC